MTVIVAGPDQGLLNSSTTILNREHRVAKATLAEGEEFVTNVANGNLVVQERDALLISQGVDLDLVRTYNSRGQLGNGPSKGSAAGWRWSFEVTLEATEDVSASGAKVPGYLVTDGDGTEFRFVFDAARGYWVSTDGAGSHEILQVISAPKAGEPAYVLTRDDRTRYEFDAKRNLIAVVDRNGVRTRYLYSPDGRVTQLIDAQGRSFKLVYEGNNVVQVTDEKDVTLVSYQYGKGQPGNRQVVAVTDRLGLTTRYSYNNDGTLARIDLPDTQVINGVRQAFEARFWTFKYVD